MPISPIRSFLPVPVFSQSEDYFDLGVSRVCLLYPQPSCTRSLTVQRQHQKE
ncbi:hypothetical protein HZ326_24511, partial [Fusarium oxysporum f. sp. albedinis]